MFSCMCYSMSRLREISLISTGSGVVSELSETDGRVSTSTLLFPGASSLTTDMYNTTFITTLGESISTGAFNQELDRHTPTGLQSLRMEINSDVSNSWRIIYDQDYDPNLEMLMESDKFAHPRSGKPLKIFTT